LSAGTGVTISSGEISIGQAVGTTDDVTFNNLSVNGALNTDDITATTVTASGNVVISGNLTVNGTTTTINTTELAVEDINITIASGATDATAANGAGLTADLGTDGTATFTYNSVNDRWVMNKSLATNLIGNVTGIVSDISNHTTTDLSEGDNLYYTNTRVRNAISVTDAGGDGSVTYNSTTGVITYTGPSAAEVRAHFSAAGDLSYNNTTGEFSVTTFKTADARNSISVTDAGGDGSLSYQLV